jgi:hypothetical protein
MVNKEDFIKRTIYLIEKILKESLPEYTTLDEMATKRSELLQRFLK